MNLDDHPFSNRYIRLESGSADTSMTAWLGWVKYAEKLLGHSLDGDDQNNLTGCGYSLDEAGSLFDAGWSASRYVAEVQGRDRYDFGKCVK